MWTDDPSEYADARIIFQDFESSNWTYDPVAEQYYWHRFYHHQPDLNFENPAVVDAVKELLDASALGSILLIETGGSIRFPTCPGWPRYW